MSPISAGMWGPWLPSELKPEDRQTILEELVSKTLNEIDKALDLEPDGKLRSQRRATLLLVTRKWKMVISGEDGAGSPSEPRSQANLLDRLLYKGVLPRYAFPTDIVAFHVFDRTSLSRSTPSSGTHQARDCPLRSANMRLARSSRSMTRSGPPGRSTLRCTRNASRHGATSGCTSSARSATTPSTFRTTRQSVVRSATVPHAEPSTSSARR